MITDVEHALTRAGADLRGALDSVALRAIGPPVHRRSRGLAVGIVALVVTAAGFTALVVTRQQQAPPLAAQSAIGAPDATAQLRADFVAVVGELGWGSLDGAPWEGQSYIDTDMSTYTDVTITPTAGETYLVSVRDNAPSWTGHDQTGLLYSEDGVDVLLRTHGPQAVSVELYDADTIVYLRSESQDQTATPAGALLAAILAVHARWEHHRGLGFGTQVTTPIEGRQPESTLPPVIGARVYVQATNGEMGYVDRSLLEELTGATVASPDEAVAWTAWQNAVGDDRIEIPVFDETGTRQIGVFPIDSTPISTP